MIFFFCKKDEFYIFTVDNRSLVWNNNKKNILTIAVQSYSVYVNEASVASGEINRKIKS